LLLGEVGIKEAKLINLKTIKQMGNNNSESINTQSCQTAVVHSAVNLNKFLNDKGIEYPDLIVDKNYKTHTLCGLIAEYADLISNGK